jgi:hypothetical protein
LITAIAFGDTHSNSTVGLCAPNCYLDDGQLISLSRGQKWLWECWLDFADRVARIHKHNLVVAFANGDLGEVDRKQRSYQLFSGNKATIKNIACNTLEPVINNVDRIWFTRGTGTHVGKSAYIEELIAHDFTNTVMADKEKKIYSHWELLIQLEEIKLDIAHHTSMGNLPWTQRNYGNAIAARTIFECAENDLPIPDIVIRSHVHRWADSYDNYPKPRAIILPAWTLATEYIHRMKPQTLAEIGAALIHIDGDKYEIEKIKYRPEGRSFIKPNLSRVKNANKRKRITARTD